MGVGKYFRKGIREALNPLKWEERDLDVVMSVFKEEKTGIGIAEALVSRFRDVDGVLNR